MRFIGKKVLMSVLALFGLFVNTVNSQRIINPGGDPMVVTFQNLHMAVAMGTVYDLEDLLRRLTNADTYFAIDVRDARGMTPFLVAVSTEKEAVVEFLTNVGADYFARDNAGDGVWHHVALTCNYSMAQCLIGLGVTTGFDVSNHTGEQPLTYLGDCFNDNIPAQEDKIIALIRLFLDNGASLDQLRGGHRLWLQHIINTVHAGEDGENGNYAAIREYFVRYNDEDGVPAPGDGG